MSVKAVNSLFQPDVDGNRPSVEMFTVPDCGSVQITICDLPEGAKICLNGLFDKCGESKQRWPIYDECGCPQCIVGPADYTGCVDECGSYELTVEGELGDATIQAIVREEPKCGTYND